MKPPPFKYFAAGTVDEAVQALVENRGEAKLLAGGQSLVAMLNFRLLGPELLVDLNRIPGLDGIEMEAGGLTIGALARHARVERSALVREHFPVLATAISHVGHLAIRNRGTAGGSLAQADPAAEWPMLALLLEAQIAVTGGTGGRTIPARDFFRGPLATALLDDEMVTAVSFPKLAPGTGWGFEEVARRAGDFALAGVAATLSLAGGRVHDARIAVTGAGETPLRIDAGEGLLKDTVPTPEVIRAAAQAAADQVRPMSDLHGSADYRRHLVGVLAGRALEAAWRRAGGGGP